MKTYAKRDFLIGLFTTIFALALRFWLIPQYVKVPKTLATDGVGPDAFPVFISYMLLVLGATLVIRTILTDRSAAKDCLRYLASSLKTNKRDLRNVLIVLLIVIGYYALIVGISSIINGYGFVIASPVVMIVLALWFRWKRPIVLILTALGVTGTVYYVFSVVMHVYLK